jgi:septal ring factor EnvC (AmiA/AmiB activator)
MNLPTPTPRTDSAWAKTFEDDEDQCLAGNAASDMRDECATLERELAALTAERDHLHAQLRALTLICGTNDANKFETWIDRANARAERAEAELAAEREKVRVLLNLRKNSQLP